jgi:HD-GYP domain-containing protein (c-di-GMP phosphodiesterase class II)
LVNDKLGWEFRDAKQRLNYPESGTETLIMAREEIPEWAMIIAKTLMAALKERDPYTYGHCRRVAQTARQLAQAAGLSDNQQNIVEYSSLFHDLGKLGIPDAILLKPGRLSENERAIIREHPIKSAEIVTPLTQIPFFRSTLPGIRHHHERIDGMGYPDGVSGENIPLTARIILIADTFDAMTTTRPYRKGMDADVAYKELKQFAGRQFDAQLVNIFVKAHSGFTKIEEEITEEFITATSLRRAG